MTDPKSGPTGKGIMPEWVSVYEGRAVTHSSRQEADSFGEQVRGRLALLPVNPPKTAWLVFVVLDGERQHEQLYASEQEAIEEFLKALQKISDEQDVPSLADALGEPGIFNRADNDLSYYRDMQPAWAGHLEYLQNEQSISVDAWITELNLP
ncbi:hypothetical protein [Microvirga tunisiensis]|uniref:Uncharacterized protein n=1 Tax=Microvirga tunisiensis TaxID=2108360 RepID=A0A5N7MSG8_9HYPH|nr:hypothetical protein [Microvirga tunisiensis]MPR11945.1 hypothetical protein [Microvirga tunisiensis]MPR29903.1 hypothetical protein [Microvirga tunisiensis]